VVGGQLVQRSNNTGSMMCDSVEQSNDPRERLNVLYFPFRVVCPLWWGEGLPRRRLGEGGLPNGQIAVAKFPMILVESRD
jgi:hypothetical protein